MSKIDTLKKLIKNDRTAIPIAIFNNILHTGILDHMNDTRFIKITYRVKMGKKLNLENPQTFNEKLQWNKLYDRNPLYTILVDKYKVRDVIADKIGDEYLIPLLGVWDRPEDIDFDSLPEKFVLKCNHDSGSVIICLDKNNFDREQAKEKLGKALKRNLYYFGREWPYKDVPPKIICEKYMTDDDESSGLTDYKFFCFGGQPDCVMLALERNTGNPKFYFFDKDWNLLRYNKRGIAAPENFTVPMPSNMPKMFELAQILSQGLPFVRVDLYNCNNKIYFGEMTFFPDSGVDANLLPETDERFGKLLIIDN